MHELKKQKNNADINNVTLIGHSNGGDMVMLFTTKYPKQVNNVISLDNLRMPFPRLSNPHILSLRAYDTIADINVLPNQNEQHKFGIKIIKIPQAKHIDYCDRGPEDIKNRINKILLGFLRNKF